MLSNLFGSRVRAKALCWLLCHPDERFFVRQLESITKEDATNLSRELARLARMGILTCVKEGREKYYQADRACAVFPELQGLAVKTLGVADVLRSALESLSGRISVAFLYGSFACGEQRIGSDVDLVVVGEVSFGEVVSALAEAQRELRREANPTVFPPEEFRRKAAAGDHFVKAVMDGPKVFVIGDLHEFAGVVEQPLAGAAPGQPPGDRDAPGGGGP